MRQFDVLNKLLHLLSLQQNVCLSFVLTCPKIFIIYLNQATIMTVI